MVDGRWSMVDGRWSMVDGRWSMVDGHMRCGLVKYLSISQAVNLIDHRPSTIDHRPSTLVDKPVVGAAIKDVG